MLSVVAVVAIATVVLSGPLSEAALSHGGAHDAETEVPVSAVTGFTKVGFTVDHLVVVNVLAGEAMSEMEMGSEMSEMDMPVMEMRPTASAGDLMPDVRHVKVHIYDRKTGLAVTDVIPIIEVIDDRTGETTVLSPMLMLDANIAGADIHFGDNVVVAGGTDLRVRVTLGPDSEVVVDGHLY